MSSIRPLATITVLALVGVFLYLKINETEPPLPEGVEDWSATADIQFDMGGADLTTSPQIATAPAGAAAPAFSSAPSSDSVAPAFDPAATSSAPAFTPSPSSDAAPAVAVAAPAFGSTKQEDSAVSTPALPDLPPLPEMPVAQAAPPVEKTAEPGPSTKAPATVSTPTVNSRAELPSAPNAPAKGVDTKQAQSSLFSATRLHVQAALDRGELSQALLLLSDWYGDPSLSPSEAKEVNTLLGQLAGSVIYSTEHRLEPPYLVQAGERLETIAEKYEVPWQLLAKINGITSADQLKPGQELKVVRGPFSALIDISQRKMTLMLDRRYAGKFKLDIDPNVTVEEGHWEVNQKLLTPANVSLPGASPTTPTEERSLMLSSSGGSASQMAILRGATTSNPIAEPAGRVMRLNPTDAEDIFDILSLGSKVVIRR